MTPQDWRAAGEAHAHRGHDIWFRRGGDWDDDERPVLLLIHGFPTASWDWHRIWDGLCAHFRVLAPDMIGFGWSAKPVQYRYSIFDQADLCQDLVRGQGVQTVHLLAHDYGDTVAQELLARHREGGAPLRLSSLCLLNGGLFPETHRARPVQKLLLSPLGPLVGRLMNERGFGRSFSAVFGPDTQPDAKELADFWSLVTANQGRRVFHKLIGYMHERRDNRRRWVGALQDCPLPLRLINGPEDPVSGEHMLQRYASLISDPDIVRLPGIGHYPQTEDPDGVLRAFLEFHQRPAA